MPEYGRASGGQIRMVTKSGSNRFSGSGSFFYRDDKLQANTWTRNKSPNALENSGAAPFDYKQYGYSLGGPILAEGQAVLLRGAGMGQLPGRSRPTSLTVPTAKMRTGDFSELLGANTVLQRRAQIIRDPHDRPAVPRQHHPGQPAEPERPRDAERVSRCRRPGSSSGTANAIINSENPQDQRKDNIRFDYRLNDEEPVQLPLRQVQLEGDRRVPRHVPLRAHRLGSAQHDPDGELDEHDLATTSINEFGYTYALDEVFINVLRGTRPLQAQQVRHQLPVPLPGEQGDRRQDPDDHRSPASAEIDGGPYPSSSRRADLHLHQRDDLGRRAATRSRPASSFEYSGEDDFDQINVQPIPGSTNNQNGRFEFANSTAGAHRRSASRTPRSACSPTTPRSASAPSPSGARSATDLFVQDSWRPTSKLTVEGGVRWVLLAAVVLD